MSHLEAGTLRALGIMADERSPYFPDVPTFREQGVDWKLAGWRGVGVPKDTPDEAFDKLARVTQGPDLEAHAEIVPLVAHKRAREGRVTAYVCENRVCELPTSDPEVFAKQITSVARDAKP